MITATTTPTVHEESLLINQIQMHRVIYRLEMAKLGPASGQKRVGPGTGLKIQARGPYRPKRA